MHPPPRPAPAPQHGFTLVELMIAVVVVAILASIAYPSFMGAIRKSRRAEAFTALSAIQQAQERWRTNNAAYASDLTTAPPTGLGIPSSTAGGYYALSLVDVSATGYKAVASAVAGTSQANDGDCAVLGVQMDGGNVKYAAGANAGALTYANTNPCWNR